jgi:hypothetical protein
MTTRPDYTQIAVGALVEGHVISIVGGIPTWVPASGGGGGDGYVDGPGSSTDHAIVRWDGWDGLVIQDSGVIVDDTNNVYGALSITANDYVGVGAAVPTVGQLRLSYTATNAGLWTTLFAGTDIRYIGLEGDGQIAIGDNLGTTSIRSIAANNIYFNIGATVTCEVGSGYFSVNSGGQLRLRNAADTQYIALRAPALISNSAYILPMADGSSGQMLSTNGSGTLSWATPPTGLTPPTVGENGYVAIANGGNLTYYGGVTNGYVLTWNTVSNTWIAAPGGTGDVVGPAGAEDNVVVRFDTGSGKLIQGGTVVGTAPTYDDTGNLNLRAGNSVRLYNASGVNYVGLRANVGTGTYNWIFPTGIGTPGQILHTDGTGTLYWGTAGGTGDVVGPASSTDNAIVRWDGLNGKLIQNSGVIISDTNSITGAATVAASSYMSIGSTASTTGGLRLSFGLGVYSRNWSGSGNLRLIEASGGGNFVSVGDSNCLTTSINASIVSLVTNSVSRISVYDYKEDIFLDAYSIATPIPLASSSPTSGFFLFKWRDTLCVSSITERCTIGSIRV